MHRSHNLLKRLLYIAVIIFVVFILFGLSRQIIDALQSSKRLDNAINDLGLLQEENRRLKTELQEVESVDFIEKQLRDKLNMAKPDETVVIVERKAVEKILSAQREEPKTPALPNWQGWLRLFIR